MSEQENGAKPEEEIQKDDPTAEEVAALADPGKQALDRMKEQRETAKAQAAVLKTEVEALRAAAALRDKSAEEQDIEKAKTEARAEANQRANERILRADLRAAATGKLADPSDAALYLDLTKFDVSDDGETDSDALTEAIDDLLTRKPHLAAQKQTRFEAGADQGAKGKETKAAQITKDELKDMSPEAIVKAQAEARLKDLLGAS